MILCASIPTPKDLLDRADLGPENVRLMSELLPPLTQLSPNAILVMVSNPVDVLTRFAIEFTGFPWQRVIGRCTLIDSVRLRYELSLELGIHIQDLRSYILGEHGGTQFAAMSIATAGRELIEDRPRRRELIAKVVGSGVDIFQYTGYTNYGIALSTVLIVESIIHDTRQTIPVSVAIDDYLGISDVCLSLPVVVGANGVERILHPTLNESEISAFKVSAVRVKE
jgi:L-lactate dehydrogenase